MVLLGYHMSHHFFSLYKSIFQPSNTVVVVQVQNDCRGLVSMCSINDATKPLACTMTLCFFLFKKLLSSVLCNTRKWVFCVISYYCFCHFSFVRQGSSCGIKTNCQKMSWLIAHKQMEVQSKRNKDQHIHYSK